MFSFDADKVNIKYEITPDSAPVRVITGDSRWDTHLEKTIRTQLSKGNYWVWGNVKVFAEYRGIAVHTWVRGVRASGGQREFEDVYLPDVKPGLISELRSRCYETLQQAAALQGIDLPSLELSKEDMAEALARQVKEWGIDELRGYAAAQLYKQHRRMTIDKLRAEFERVYPDPADQALFIGVHGT